MHCFPWFIVEANSVDNACKECDAWISNRIESSPYDYGGAVYPENGNKETVISYRNEAFGRNIESLIKCEEAQLAEFWAIIKQFVLKMAASPSPPKDTVKVTATSVVGRGITYLVEPGTEITSEYTGDAFYMYCEWLGKLHSHIRFGRCFLNTTEGTLFNTTDHDIDSMLKGKLPAKITKRLYLVQADLHH